MTTIMSKLLHFLIREEVRCTLLWFFATRLFLEIVAIFARTFIHGPFTFTYSKHIWLAVWGAWDSGWYLPLAHYGYSTELGTTAATVNQANYAFFPLFPGLIKLFALLTHDYVLAGILVANSALILSGIFLYKLVLADYTPGIARYTLIIYFIYPLSFLLSGILSESTYLFILIMVFYFAHKNRWLAASVAGFLLALSRPVGVFVLLPVLWEWITVSKNRRWYQLCYFGLIPLGLLLFAIYNYHLTGNPLAFITIQHGWHRQLYNPLVLILTTFWSGNTINIFNALYTIGYCFILALGWRTLRRSYRILCGYSILIPLLSGLESIPRYLLVVFPIFIIFAEYASRIPNKLRWLLISLSMLLQGVALSLWTTGFNLIK